MSTDLHHRLTPTQQEIINRHQEFQRKIAELARPDPGISCRRKSGRIPASDPVVVLPGPSPEEIAMWARRQKEIHPQFKEPWFSIEEEIEPPTREISIRDIQRAVCRHYGLSLADMLSARRARAVAIPRQIAGYLAKMLTPFTLTAIGRKFGGRDHSTQHHAIRKVTSLMESDPALRAKVEEIARELGGDLG